jgi:phospholipase/carboxylesterase
MRLSRRRLLGLTGWTLVAGGAVEARIGDRVGINVDTGQRWAADPGRLLARPGPPPVGPVPLGLQPLALKEDRDGLIYVPSGYQPERPLPLVVMLHGANADARNGIDPLLGLADQAGLLLVAPESRNRTWDVILDGYGPDVAFIDQVLAHTFARCAVDSERIAVGGFSDGASYALGLGLINGDVFSRVVAFSPGFVPPHRQRGKPTIFIAHGTRDEVLPIATTSRRIVPQLQQAGYAVRYVEFDGPHLVPADIARQGTDWLTESSSP